MADELEECEKCHVRAPKEVDTTRVGPHSERVDYLCTCCGHTSFEYRGAPYDDRYVPTPSTLIEP